MNDNENRGRISEIQKTLTPLAFREKKYPQN